MTEATTATTKATTAKSASFGLPKVDMAKMEVPAEFREMADKGLAHATDTYAKAKAASEEAAELLDRCHGRHELQSQGDRDRPHKHLRCF
jgi:hypothetical protein